MPTASTSKTNKSEMDQQRKREQQLPHVGSPSAVVTTNGNPTEQRHFDVEAQQNARSVCRREPIRDAVRSLILSMDGLSFVTQPSVVLTPTDFRHVTILQDHVNKIVIPDLDAHRERPVEALDLTRGLLDIHVYTLNASEPQNEQLEGEEELAAASHYLLPSLEYEGLWESLIYDSHIKWELLNYASTSLSFSEAGVDDNLVACNRVVLLHGPPGTGKTSLCKALAQKLVIQFSDKYEHGQLVEINSHSLFSKWFSESGKLVMKMFQNIEEFIEDSKSLVFLLIDEVESLTAARKAAANGNEPSDAIRVVNALLTQIDRIKRHPNVFILTTSNLTGAIDLAFVDRADIKQFIGPPTRNAIAAIYESCVQELLAKDLIRFSEDYGEDVIGSGNRLPQLTEVATNSLGFSGRTLRKLPFIAFAVFIRSSSTKPTLDQFLVALNQAVDRQKEERSHIPEQRQ